MASERISSLAAAGHAILLLPQSGMAETGEEHPERIVRRLALEDHEWNAVKHRLGVQDAVGAILLSPSGKVLAAARDAQEVEKEAERFETCVAMAVVESALEGSQVTRSADEWAQELADTENSAFNIVSRHNETERHARDRSPSLTELSETIALLPSVGALAIDRTTSPPLMDTHHEKPMNDSALKMPATSRGEREPTKLEPEKGELYERKVSAAKTINKVAIKFSNGSPRQIIEVNDPRALTFQDLVSQVSEPVTSLLQEFPRKEFTIIEHGSMTLDQLELDSNPSLVAIVRSNAVSGSTGPHDNPFTKLLALIWSMIMWLAELLRGFVTTTQQVQPEARQTVGERSAPNYKGIKRPNEYWNGDSTVFEGQDPDEDTGGN